MLIWKPVERKFGSNIEIAMLGTIVIGEVGYKSTNAYYSNCYLPGFKNQNGEAPSIDEAKIQVERKFVAWLGATGLKND